MENNTVSYRTTHFSTYMLVDKTIWFQTWKETLNYRKENVVYDFAYVLIVPVVCQVQGFRMQLRRLEDLQTV